MIRLYVIAAILAILASFAYYVNTLVSDLEKANADNVTLTNVVDDQATTINGLREDFTLANKVNSDLRNVVNTQQKEINNLNEKFNIKANGQSRDFGAITRERATLINKIINVATDNVNRCFELITGAKKTNGEKNNECEEFINSFTD